MIFYQKRNESARNDPSPSRAACKPIDKSYTSKANKQKMQYALKKNIFPNLCI